MVHTFEQIFNNKIFQIHEQAHTWHTKNKIQCKGITSIESEESGMDNINNMGNQH